MCSENIKRQAPPEQESGTTFTAGQMLSNTHGLQGVAHFLGPNIGGEILIGWHRIRHT